MWQGLVNVGRLSIPGDSSAPYFAVLGNPSCPEFGTQREVAHEKQAAPPNSAQLNAPRPGHDVLSKTAKYGAVEPPAGILPKV